MTNTTATLALALDTTPRTLRKFLRSPDSPVAPVGKGSRYTLPSTKREVNKMQKQFTAWSEAQAAKKVTKVEDAPEAPITDEVDSDEVIDFDSLECPLDN